MASKVMLEIIEEKMQRFKDKPQEEQDKLRAFLLSAGEIVDKRMEANDDIFKKLWNDLQENK